MKTFMLRVLEHRDNELRKSKERSKRKSNREKGRGKEVGFRRKGERTKFSYWFPDF
jgi:hypothetical protein